MISFTIYRDNAYLTVLIDVNFRFGLLLLLSYLFSHGKNEDFRHDYPSNTSISVSKTLAISFHCMTTYKSTAITTDRKDSDSSVQRELSYPSRHALFSVTQSKLPCPIKYDRKCGRFTTRFQPCSIIYAISPQKVTRVTRPNSTSYSNAHTYLRHVLAYNCNSHLTRVGIQCYSSYLCYSEC